MGKVTGNDEGRLQEILAGGEAVIVPEDLSSVGALCMSLNMAMQSEISSLKHIMTKQRRVLAYSFILECFDRLIQYERKETLRKGAQESTLQ